MKRPPFPIEMELKCWSEFYDAILDNRKGFDVRCGNDREYLVGDTVLLREWSPNKGYTGRNHKEVISYVMHGAPFLPEDVWVLGFAGVHVLKDTE